MFVGVLVTGIISTWSSQRSQNNTVINDIYSHSQCAYDTTIHTLTSHKDGGENRIRGKQVIFFLNVMFLYVTMWRYSKQKRGEKHGAHTWDEVEEVIMEAGGREEKKKKKISHFNKDHVNVL